MNFKNALGSGLLLMLASAAPAAPTVHSEMDLFLQGVTYDKARPLAYKFEEYRSVPNGLYVERYKLDLGWSGYDLTFKARNISQRDEEASLSGGRPGVVSYRFSWNRIPHRYSNEARTLYDNKGNGVLTLPDGLQNYFQGASTTVYVATSSGMRSFFLADAQDVAPLQMQSDRAAVDMTFRPGKELLVSLSGSRLHRSGTRAQGSTFGHSDAIELPAPINDDTYDASMGMDYLGKSIQAGVKAGVSKFENAYTSIVWDNPKRLTDRYTNTTGPNASRGRISTAPDNLAKSLNASLGVDLPMKSRFSADAGYVIMTQEDTMLPYTINSAMTAAAAAAVSGTANDPPFDLSDPANLPARNLDMEMRVLSQKYRLSTKGLGPVRASAGWRSYKLENKSEEYAFPGRARYDTSWSVESLKNRLFEFERRNADARADVDLGQRVAVGAVVGREWVERHREVEKSEEDSASGSLVFKPRHDLFLSSSYLVAERKMEEFEIADYKNSAGTFIEMPGLRRFDVTDRDRKQGRVAAQFAPGEVSLGLSAQVTNDEFGKGKGDLTGGITTNQNKMYGLLEQLNRTYGTELSFPLLAGLEGGLYYEFEWSRRMVQSNSNATSTASQDAATDWKIRALERSKIGGVSVKLPPKGRWDAALGYDLVLSRLDTNIVEQGSGLVGYQSFKQADRTQQTASARIGYKVTDNIRLTGRYSWDKFDITDYATDDVPLFSVTGVNLNDATYLGASVRDYVVQTVGIGLSYVF